MTYQIIHNLKMSTLEGFHYTTKTYVIMLLEIKCDALQRHICISYYDTLQRNGIYILYKVAYHDKLQTHVQKIYSYARFACFHVGKVTSSIRLSNLR